MQRLPRLRRNVVLLQELFETPYFYKDHIAAPGTYACSRSPSRMGDISAASFRELGVVCWNQACSSVPTTRSTIPSSWLTPTGRSSAAIANRTFRKDRGITRSSIFAQRPPAWVFPPRYAKVGCRDLLGSMVSQAARSMALMSAEILLYQQR